MIVGGRFPDLNWLEEEILDRPGIGKCDLFLTMMNKYGLSQHIKDIGCPASNKIMDHILKISQAQLCMFFCAPGMSDHNAIIGMLTIIS